MSWARRQRGGGDSNSSRYIYISKQFNYKYIRMYKTNSNLGNFCGVLQYNYNDAMFNDTNTIYNVQSFNN